jgi:hypothetical protein
MVKTGRGISRDGPKRRSAPVRLFLIFFYSFQGCRGHCFDSARLDQLPPDSEDLSFGNSVYKIRFEERNSRPLFGHRYYFYLQDAVENVPEYIVDWDNFVE